MAKIKYASGADPLVNEHDGFTFQRNNYGQSMFPSARNDRKRYPNQWNRMHNIQKTITRWRNMPQSVKDQWALFASTFPQPSKQDPNYFLSGYQLFLKRNSYCFLNHGIYTDFMEEPEIVELPEETITFEIAWSDDAIDATELYIKNWGILPEVGDYVILYAHIYAEFSGQFFTPVKQVLEVKEIYMDGLFVSVVVPDTMLTVTISVYLSKVFHQSVTYAGTKIRYMGCFTKKRFIDLIDTPGSYSGQQGKIPAVNAAEDGLEFIEAGGAGFDCDDLLDCDIIIEILERINDLEDIIVEKGDSSIPPVYMGYLYNDLVMLDSRLPASGWHVPTTPDWDVLKNNIISHDSDNLGYLVQNDNPNAWLDVDNENQNLLEFNNNGAGVYFYNPWSDVMVFKDIQEKCRIWAATYSAPLDYPARSYDLVEQLNSDNRFQTGFYNDYYYIGATIRLVKDNTTLQHGQSGMYVGNDGKKYRTIAIGDSAGNNVQEWLADNLAETEFSDGSSIETVNDHDVWKNHGGPYKTPYDWDESYV